MYDAGTTVSIIIALTLGLMVVSLVFVVEILKLRKVVKYLRARYIKIKSLGRKPKYYNWQQGK